MAPELPSQIVAAISFVGRSGGAIKTLSGFRRPQHTVPDAANPATNAFLARICAAELADEAERLFQNARAALAYKRKEIVLTVTSPAANLVAKDFAVELLYAIDESDPARYRVTTTLRDLSGPQIAHGEAFAGIFARRFTEIEFGLKKAASVEAIIDVVEALNGENGITVTYPSDYQYCTIRVDEVDAEVRCSGAALNLIFARGGNPGELIDGFAVVREAFQISKVLRGLIGEQDT